MEGVADGAFDSRGSLAAGVALVFVDAFESSGAAFRFGGVALVFVDAFEEGVADGAFDSGGSLAAGVALVFVAFEISGDALRF